MKSRKNSIQRLKKYAHEERSSLIRGFIFSLSRTILEILGPMVIAYILNNLLGKNMTMDSIKKIAMFLVLYFFIYLSIAFLLNKARLSFEKSANKIALMIQKDVYNKVQTFPISYFDNLPSGKISSRITKDANKLKTMFQLLLSDILTSAILIVGLYTTIFVTNKIAALMLLILFPLVILIFKTYLDKTYFYTSKIKKYTADVNAKINEYIQNMEIIQAFNQEETIDSKFDKTNKKIYDINMKLSKLRSCSGYRAMDILNYLATIVVIIYFSVGSITGKYAVTVGSLYMVIDYTSKLFNNMTTIIMRFGDVEDALSSADHIFNILDMESMENLPDKLNNIEGDIEFKDVSFAYKEEDVLKNINFLVKSNQSQAFVGQTGSGKSTIINLLLNFYSPRLGSISIGGQDISLVDRDDLRKDMAVVLQDAFLFKSTIRENISLGEKFTDKDIIESLKAVGSERLIAKGLDSQVLENGSNLSQGEKQLISFARAYIRDPKVLILDEATSNIDTETERIIQEGINKLKENRTTFIIAHRLSTIKEVDNIIVLSYGKIIEQGNHEELMKLGGYYKKMYDKQIKDLEVEWFWISSKYVSIINLFMV